MYESPISVQENICDQVSDRQTPYYIKHVIVELYRCFRRQVTFDRELIQIVCHLVLLETENGQQVEQENV